MVDYALDEGVQALLISGDLFDSDQRSAKTAAFLIAEFDRLASQDVEVLYIKGNHDAENPVTGGLSFPGNVHVFSGHGGKKQLKDSDVWIHGVSFSGKHAPESLAEKIPDPEPHAINIAMLHTSLAGSPGHDVYAPCSVDELKQRGFDYWALGHIHKRQVHCEQPWIVMPGIPQGRDIGEHGAKSATVLSIADGAITTHELPTSSIEFMEANIDIKSIESLELLRAKLREEFDTLVENLASPKAVVRVRLCGQSTLRWQLIRDQKQWYEIISRYAADTGRLWIEKFKLDLDDEPKTAVDASAVVELEAMMNDIRGDKWFKEQATIEIDTVLGHLPAAQRKLLLESESAMDRLAEQLGSEGAEYLIAAMHGDSN